MGTATVLTPVDQTTFGPTVDSTFFLRSTVSNAVALAQSGMDDGGIEAPGLFRVDSQTSQTEGFLHGFLYLAENGGTVKVGEGANAYFSSSASIRASIGDAFLGANVTLNPNGVKTAVLNSNLLGLPNGGVVGSVNHLFEFVVPISEGALVQMISVIDHDFHGTASSLLPGDGATIQWSFKATAWAYATEALPSIEFNTLVRRIGDFNGDGNVDAADYTVWRDALGQTGVSLAADGDENGIVDEFDYLIWKYTYGTTIEPPPGFGALAITVPEPTSVSLTILALIAATLIRVLRTRRAQMSIML